MSEVGPVFDRVMRELGLEPMEKQPALRVLVGYFAQQIVDGVVEPYEGASRIWSEAWPDYEPHEQISSFVGLASQIDDYHQLALTQPDPYLAYIKACTDEIVAEAREYLSQSS